MTTDSDGHLAPSLGRTYAPIFGRAFLQVALVAWNVRNVAAGNYGLAFATGSAVSWVWWMNSRCAAHTEAKHGRAVYALGAGAGTVCGMALGAWL